MDESQSIVTKPQWQPLSPQSLAAVVVRPSAVADYAAAFSAGKKPDHSLALLVRKQLLLSDWKIEWICDRRSARYRYTSPIDGKIYLSLHVLCNDIVNSSPVGFDSVDVLPRKRKIRDNDDDRDVDYVECEKEQEHEIEDGDDASDSLSSEITELKSEDDEEDSFKDLKLRRIKQRNFGPGVLSSLIDNNVVEEGARVHYRASKSRNRLTEGIITRNGIECDCCRGIFALTKFEAHAGSTNHRPAANIILEDGRSLSDCQRQLEGNSDFLLPKKKPSNMLRRKTKAKMMKLNTASKKRGRKMRKHKEDNEGFSDYLCSVCRQEGDLILCDECPSAFHSICLGMKEVPTGHWCCPFCCCDHCDSSKFNNRLVRNGGYILRCEQCPVKIHIGCAKEKGMNCGLEKNPGWFCSEKCRYISQNMQNLLGKPISVGEDNLTWTLLKRRWPKSSENNKLSLALDVFHECFDPVTEFYTGRDLVEDVIFSKTSRLPRVNFRRFYTILMEKNNEPIAVANLRIHGDKVAEVPLVATKFEYRRIGMCRKLMEELERQLIRLGVEKLVLPSAATTLQTWIDGFGFSEMAEDERKQCFKYSFLDFQGTIMCQKLLTKK